MLMAEDGITHMADLEGPAEELDAEERGAQGAIQFLHSAG